VPFASSSSWLRSLQVPEPSQRTLPPGNNSLSRSKSRAAASRNAERVKMSHLSREDVPEMNSAARSLASERSVGPTAETGTRSRHHRRRSHESLSSSPEGAPDRRDIRNPRLVRFRARRVAVTFTKGGDSTHQTARPLFSRSYRVETSPANAGSMLRTCSRRPRPPSSSAADDCRSARRCQSSSAPGQK
jgi:hypothetical protein